MERLRVGDLVQVISGKEKGKKGKITKILRDRDLVVVEGVNLVKRHTKPNAQNDKGGIVTKEAPLFSSKVMPIDPTTGKPTRVKIKVEGEKKVRVGKSGAVISTEA